GHLRLPAGAGLLDDSARHPRALLRVRHRAALAPALRDLVGRAQGTPPRPQALSPGAEAAQGRRRGGADRPAPNAPAGGGGREPFQNAAGDSFQNAPSRLDAHLPSTYGSGSERFRRRGLVAEWLRRGLQILARRFDSGRGLQTSSLA